MNYPVTLCSRGRESRAFNRAFERCLICKCPITFILREHLLFLCMRHLKAMSIRVRVYAFSY